MLVKHIICIWISLQLNALLDRLNKKQISGHRFLQLFALFRVSETVVVKQINFICEPCKSPYLENVLSESMFTKSVF